jgi:hypothetical protein
MDLRYILFGQMRHQYPAIVFFFGGFNITDPIVVLQQPVFIKFQTGPVQYQFLLMKSILPEKQPLFHQIHATTLCQGRVVLEQLVREYYGNCFSDTG